MTNTHDDKGLGVVEHLLERFTPEDLKLLAEVPEDIFHEVLGKWVEVYKLRKAQEAES
jgi:hypothetical protein